MATYTAIKRESTFPVIVGGNTLINLQKLLLYILADKTEQEIKDAYDKIVKQQYDEEWYEHYAFLVIFITNLEKTAREKGLTIEENLDATSQPEN